MLERNLRGKKMRNEKGKKRERKGKKETGKGKNGKEENEKNCEKNITSIIITCADCVQHALS